MVIPVSFFDKNEISVLKIEIFMLTFLQSNQLIQNLISTDTELIREINWREENDLPEIIGWIQTNLLFSGSHEMSVFLDILATLIETMVKLALMW